MRMEREDRQKEEEEEGEKEDESIGSIQVEKSLPSLLIEHLSIPPSNACTRDAILIPFSNLRGTSGKNGEWIQRTSTSRFITSPPLVQPTTSVIHTFSQVMDIRTKFWSCCHGHQLLIFLCLPNGSCCKQGELFQKLFQSGRTALARTFSRVEVQRNFLSQLMCSGRKPLFCVLSTTMRGEQTFDLKKGIKMMNCTSSIHAFSICSKRMDHSCTFHSTF